MNVTHLSKLTKISPHTIRYYAKLKLLNPKRDPNNNYQLFSSDDLARLRFIARAKKLGFKLNEITQILNDAYKKKCTCKKVKNIIEHRIQENREHLKELLALQTRMEQALEQWTHFPGGNPHSDNICHLIENWDKE